jgi:hypothetical protein
MSVAEHRTVARPPSPAARPRIQQAVAQALNWLDGRDKNPYSPLVCVSALLLVGLVIKLGPGLHAVLAHN